MRSSSLSRKWQRNQGTEIKRVLAKTSNWLDNIVVGDGDANEDDDEDDDDEVRDSAVVVLPSRSGGDRQ